MKKKLLAAVGIIIGIGVLTFSFFQTSSSSNEPSLTNTEIKNLVSEQYPGEIAEPELKIDANQPVYEIDVTDNETVYGLKLDGHTGEVLNIVKKEVKKKPATTKKPKEEKKVSKKLKEPSKEPKEEKPKEEPKEQAKEKQDKEKEVPKTVLSVEEVSKIALQQFSGEIDEIELDEENGRLIYEIEIERGEQEAEIEIDAYTGEVIVIEIDED